MAGNLYLEITNACVHSCRTCPHGTGNPRRSGYHIPFDKVTEIVDPAIEERGIGSVTISGGEPLMHPEFLRIIDYLFSKGLYITVLSNLHLFNEKNFGDAVKPYSSKLCFVTAFHSSTPERHDGITNCPGSFERALSSVDTLVSLGISVTIKCILCLDTAKELENIFELSTNRWGMGVDFDLCGMDLCGADKETLGSVIIDFEKESEYLNKVLFKAEQFYHDLLDKKVMITEYPLCWVDPYYWKLVRTGSSDRMLAFVSSGKIDVTDRAHNDSYCHPPFIPSCCKCLVHHLCPGIWPSVVDHYGDELTVKPV